MAENNLFVGKWLPSGTVEVEDVEKQVVQFYKDGSCLIPAALLGKDGADYPMFYFYQVFENGMMKLESGEPTMNLYHCAMVGDTLTLTALDGEAFSFVKVKEEKKSFFKPKNVDAAPAAATVKKGKEPEPEREPEEHEWKCPSCGKINQNYVGTCGCGAPKPNDKLFNWREVHPELVQKPEEEEAPVIAAEPEKEPEPEKPAEPEKPVGDNEWRCPSCGKINQKYVGTCGCGERKPANVGPYIPTAEAMARMTPEDNVVKAAPEKPAETEE